MQEIIQGDCLEVMKTFPDNHFSAVVTDPPYGLSFMGKGWDHAVPGKEYWEECLRITKPGGHLLAMGGTRTFHRLASAIEDSGYEIRDCLMWIYGSGFPKSHNKFGCEGYGTALKPAYEPIILSMKPLDGTFAQNAEKWCQAGINIDGSRIGSVTRINSSSAKHERNCFIKGFISGTKNEIINKGRWPANVIFDEEAAAMLDEHSGVLKSGQHNGFLSGESKNEVYGKRAAKNINPFQANFGGASRFFYCAKTSSKERNEGLEGFPDSLLKTHGDIRSCDNAKPSPQLGPKVKNNHPTVKPLKLMEYLIKLVMPPNDQETQDQIQERQSLESSSQELDVSKKSFKRPILLDPFAGSGSTILAAKNLGFDAIGIEKQPEYAEIATARILSIPRHSI